MKDSHIQWTDNTFNPWEGCTKVSPGCLNCYAETRNARFGGGTAPNWGAGKPRRRTSEGNWREPARWNAAAQKLLESFNREAPLTGMEGLNRTPPTPPRVFCASLADWLDNEVPIEWLADLLTLIFDCGFLDWQLLTKRPENFKARLLLSSTYLRYHAEPTERNHAIRGWIDGWVDGKPPGNVWVGTSVEDQLRADVRIPRLLAIPAVVRFLSVEPLLERVEFSNVTNRPDAVAVLGKRAIEGIHWVIVGGESGPRARPTSVDAIESVIYQCRGAGVPLFVKQLGSRPVSTAHPPSVNCRGGLPNFWWILRHSKGGDPAEWPERFRLAEFPEVKR